MCATFSILIKICCLLTLKVTYTFLEVLLFNNALKCQYRCYYFRHVTTVQRECDKSKQ